MSVTEKRRRWKLILHITTAVILGTSAWYMGNKHGPFNLPQTQKMGCVKEATVEEILELRYRDAVILLSTGDQVKVNQARLKPGDTYCLKRGLVDIK